MPKNVYFCTLFQTDENKDMNKGNVCPMLACLVGNLLFSGALPFAAATASRLAGGIASPGRESTENKKHKNKI